VIVEAVALPEAEAVPLAPAPAAPPRGSVLAAARYYLEHVPPSVFTPDCSGFVAAVFTLAGLPLAGSPPWMWDRAVAAGAVHQRPLPSPGDIAFFDDTYDRDGNGRRDDPKSHVAVVLSVDAASGDLRLAHGGATSGRATFRMNLAHPHDPSRNSGLRRPNRRDDPDVPRLAGELWAGFATVRPEDLPVWAFDVRGLGRGPEAP
jgi:peptidoglycan DL-endopeptidase CwlO